MAVDFAEAHRLISQYEDVYRSRHEAFRVLRRIWHGDYWKIADYEQSRPITSIFRDLTSHMSDIGPEVKLVHNVVNMVCLKFMTFLSPLPQIRVWVDQPGTDTRRAQATRKQRYLYGIWHENSMSSRLNTMAWYLPLMGDCYFGIHPDFDKNLPTAIVRSPEFAYPIPGFDKNSEQAVCFRWKIAESVAAKNFVEYTAPIRQMQQDRQGKFKRGQPTDPQVEIVEYSDDTEWHRWIAQVGPRSTSQKEGPVIGTPTEVNGSIHNLGFNLFDHVKFVEVPDDVWGHGAVEQAVNLNEMHNALISLLFQNVIENVFPKLVLEDPQKAPEDIATGPGAILPLNPGGKAYYLTPPVQALSAQEQFMNLNVHNIKESSGMPEINFGQSPATSIVTGKAVDELQGAGTGSMVEMVQGTGIGGALVSFNEKAIAMGQRMFRDDTMNLFGTEYKSYKDLIPQQFELSLKGKDLIGSPRNEVVFAPALNQHEKLVMNLQGLGAGLWSKKYVREQHGLSDNQAMEEEIFAEAAEAGVLGAILQAMQEPTPESAAKAEDQAFAYLQGEVKKGAEQSGQLPPPAAHPLLSLPQTAAQPLPPGAPVPTPATTPAQ